jgi:hypothetical protein
LQGTFGIPKVWLDGLPLSVRMERPGMNHTQKGPLAYQVMGQGINPTLYGFHRTPKDRRFCNGLDQISRTVKVLTGNGVVQGLSLEVVLDEPGTSTPV